MSQRRNSLVVVLMLLALAALACNLSSDTGSTASSAVSALPTANIQVPVNGMSFVEGANAIIQVIGTDAGAGISRIDLLIDDLPAGSSTAPVAAGQSTYIATFEWTATGQGAHAISAVALRADGTSSSLALISVTVVAAPATEVPATEALPTEIPPTEAAAEETGEEAPPADEGAPPDGEGAPPGDEGAAPAEEEEEDEEPTGPVATTNAGVNVRSGPGTDYSLVGSWLAGTELELTGRNADNTWFRAPYYLGEGWIFAGLLDITGDVNTLPVINVPLPPTAVPPTAIPTAVPLPTSIPATAAPVNTEPYVNFWSTIQDGVTYDEDTCFTFYWDTANVDEVYFEDDEVAGTNTGGEQDCPDGTGTFTYELKVVVDDDEDVYYIYVTLED